MSGFKRYKNKFFLYTNVFHYFCLAYLRLFKLKTVTEQSYKTQIKILPYPGLD